MIVRRSAKIIREPLVTHNFIDITAVDFVASLVSIRFHLFTRNWFALFVMTFDFVHLISFISFGMFNRNVGPHFGVKSKRFPRGHCFNHQRTHGFFLPISFVFSFNELQSVSIWFCLLSYTIYRYDSNMYFVCIFLYFRFLIHIKNYTWT